MISDEASNRLSGKVIQYVSFIKDMSAKAKTSNYSKANWDPLATMVAPNFVRVGRYGEVQSWEECVSLMHEWAGKGDITSLVRRITEIGNKVFYEIMETSTLNGATSQFATISVITFDNNDLIERYEFFQQ